MASAGGCLRPSGNRQLRAGAVGRHPCCVGAIFLTMSRIEERENFFKEHLGLTSDELWKDWERYRDKLYAAEKAGKVKGKCSPTPVPQSAKPVATAAPSKPFADPFRRFREPVPFGVDIKSEKTLLQEPPRPVREVSADYDIRKSPYAGYRFHGGSDDVPRTESEPAENSCILVVHGVTEENSVLKFRLTQGLELEYRGSQKLGNVDKIAFIPSHVDDVRERGWFNDEDCTRIESRQIGKCVGSDVIYAGVYSIRLAGSNRRKIAFCGNLFDTISVDLRRSRNLNFRRDVYENGLRGAVVYVSPLVPDEDDRVSMRASMKRGIEKKGGEVYLNEEIEASGYETVKRYDELEGFVWRLPKEQEWHGVKSDNIVMSMYDVYETCGGKDFGMFFQLI